MTGYGRGEAIESGMRFIVELNSVNRRQNEVIVNLPKELAGLEITVREHLRQEVSRGRTQAAVSLTTAEGQEAARPRINRELAEQYVREMRELKESLDLEPPITLEAVLEAPGVVTLAPAQLEEDQAWPLLRRALDEAIAGLLKTRAKEGRYLVRDIRARLITLVSNVQKIHQLKGRVTERYRRNLEERLNNAGVELLADEDRLRKEIMIFADRSDISEELTRLESHFEQFTNLMEDPEPMGRKMEFMCQELFRELNTLTVKSNDSEISQIVVDCKTEVEKIREQVQNIE
jgi:uncharacterized protein (TIGR00255 family)